MTLLDIVTDPHLCTQMLDLMRKRGVLDDHNLIPVEDLHKSDVMAMHELLDWTALHRMDDETLARDYGLTRLPDLEHEPYLSGLEDHIIACRSTR